MPANQGNQFKFEAKQIDINNYVSFDILTQEHKDNTFWSIKQFFCHDMFSQRFSFPSWCFSLVMGKWFKGKSPGQSRGWHDRRGSVAVWARPNKKPQIASNCSEGRKQRAISHASIFSQRLKYFYDLGEIFPIVCLWYERGRVINAMSFVLVMSSSGRARPNCWSSVTFPLPRNVWRTIAGEQQWHQTWENPAHLSQLEFCQKQLLYIKIGKK